MRKATPRQAGAAVAALVILCGITAVIGFGIGVQVGAGPRMSEVKVFRNALTYVGDGQATATVDGIAYGFMGGSVPWVDAAGSSHEGGWPDCLPQRSQTRITFGGATVFGPRGTSGYTRILWVDCRPQP